MDWIKKADRKMGILQHQAGRELQKSKPEQGEEDKVVPGKMGRARSGEILCTGCTQKASRQGNSLVLVLLGQGQERSKKRCTGPGESGRTVGIEQVFFSQADARLVSVPGVGLSQSCD